MALDRLQLDLLIDGLNRLEADALREPAEDVPKALGRFQVRGQLGSGRFAIVALADDPTLKRQVALKLPRPELLADLHLRERFVREAESAARLDHPGIVPVHEVVQPGPDVVYLVLGHVTGPTLEQWLADHPSVPVPTACQLVAAIADAVQHAHERQVLHLDLKPSNILIEPGHGPVPGVGRPRVADFGLARFLDQPGAASVGVRAGTPGYMAPEQVAGPRDQLTVRTDVWALGVMLYQVLAGRPPFAGAGAKPAGTGPWEPGPLRQIRADVSSDLEAVVRWCLEPDPARRCPSASALAADLRAVLTGRPTLARPAGPAARVWKQARQRPAAAALAVLTTLVVVLGPGGVVRYLDARAAARSEHELADERENRRRDAEFSALVAGVRERLDLRPPGWTAANLEDLNRAARLPRAGENAVALRTLLAASLAGEEWHLDSRLPVPWRVERAAYSPDGRLLVVGDAGHVRDLDFMHFTVAWLDARTGALIGSRKLLKHPVKPEPDTGISGHDGTWSLTVAPDSRTVFVGTRSGWVHRFDVSAPDAVTPWRPHRYWVSDLVVSPDGARLYSVCKPDAEVVTRDLNDPARQDGRFPRAGGQPGSHACSVVPLGDRLAFVEGGRKTYWLNPETLDPIDPVAPDGTRLASAGTAPMIGRTGFSPRTGSLVDGGAGAWLWDAAHWLPVAQLATVDDPALGGENIEAMAISPDGRRAAAALGDEIVFWDLLTARVHARLAPPVLPSGGMARRIAFHPAGDRLAVPGEPGATFRLAASPVESAVAVQALAVQRFALAGDRVVTIAAARLPDRNGDTIRSWPLDGSPGIDVVAPMGGGSAGDLGASGTAKLMCWWRGGQTIVCKSEGGRVWSQPSGEASGQRGNSYAFDPSGRFLWGIHGLQLIRRTAADGQVTGTLTLPKASNEANQYWCLGASSTAILAGNRDGHVDIVDPDAAAIRSSVRVGQAGLTAISVTPDGRVAAAGTLDGRVAVLDPARGAVTQVLDAHPGRRVDTVAVHPDGRLLATGGADGVLRLWRLGAAGWEPHLDLPTGRTPVRQAEFDPAGNRLFVLLAGDRGVRVWHLDRLREAVAAHGLDE